MAQNSKPKVGIYAFSACSGCQISILNLEDILLDLFGRLNIRFAHLLQEENREEHVNILFIEGAITTAEQKEKLLQLREKTDLLIAMGSCASTGGIPAMKNETSRRTLETYVYGGKHAQPSPAQGLDRFVTVDYYLPGCPLNKEEFASSVLSLLVNKRPFQRSYPLCTECRLQENDCLLEHGEPCLGPITMMGCQAHCPSEGTPCRGCRGMWAEAELASYMQLLKKKNIKKTTIQNTLSTFLADRIEKEQIPK